MYLYLSFFLKFTQSISLFTLVTRISSQIFISNAHHYIYLHTPCNIFFNIINNSVFSRNFFLPTKNFLKKKKRKNLKFKELKTGVKYYLLHRVYIIFGDITREVVHVQALIFSFRLLLFVSPC